MYAEGQYGFTIDYEENEGFCQQYGLTVRFAVNLRRENPVQVLRFVAGLVNMYKGKRAKNDQWGVKTIYNNMRIFTGKQFVYKVNPNESRDGIYIYGWNIYQSFGFYAVIALMKVFGFEEGPIGEDQYFEIKRLARFLMFDRLPVCAEVDKLTKRTTFSYKDLAFISGVSGQDNPDRYSYPTVSPELD